MPCSEDTSALLLRLCKAMEKQTAAITRQAKAIDALAVSNEAMVNEMAAQAADADDQPEAPTHYMDGTPINPGKGN